MGLRSISLSYRIDSQDAIVAAHERLFARQRALVSPSLNGWVTVFDERLDSFQRTDILDIGSRICAMCGCAAVGLGVLHSDYFYLWVFDATGKLAACFSSEPGVPSSQPPEEAIRNLVSIFGMRVTPEALLSALTKREVFADQTLWSVANLLGVRHLGLTYSQAITEWDDIDDGFQPGWEQFRHLK